MEEQQIINQSINETRYADIIDLTFYMQYQTIMLL